MKTSPLRRLLVAFVAIVALLFAQLALASYACPGRTTAVAMQSMSDCAGMDMVQPSLCHAHLHDGHQSLDKPDVPYVALFLPTQLVLTLVPRDLHAQPGVLPATDLVRTTAPPKPILHCCFLI